ncbi:MULTISPECIES: ferredoxin [Actinomycetes]|uniref:ferredoxin n=1 Tax=Actinomycetes TaxID=1760 RepID=UPI0004C08A70
MRVRLDRDRCVGHAQCFAVDEHLFPIDDAGYSSVDQFVVGSGDQVAAREGVRACPEHALLIDE